MTAAAFQTLLARLVVEPGFRERVVAEGARALETARERVEGPSPQPPTPSLSAGERRRLLAIAGDPGLEITRVLHRGFRLSKLLAQLPLTFTLLDGESQRRELDLFWRRRPPVSFYFLEEAVAFCDHLLGRRAETEGAAPRAAPYLGEIAAYERATLELQRARPGGDEAPVQWVRFHHDPLPLLAALGEGRVPAAVPDREVYLVGRREAAGLRWSLADAADVDRAWRGGADGAAGRSRQPVGSGQAGGRGGGRHPRPEVAAPGGVAAATAP